MGIVQPPNGQSIAGPYALVGVSVWQFTHTVPNTGVPPWQGTKRLAGDSPQGRVMLGTDPASREVWIVDHATGYVATKTVSLADGTWEVVGVNGDRLFSVWFRGEDGERDVLVPRITPVEP
jgi:hypothetical protein